MVVHGIVYDCTTWGRFHPGGLDTLMEAAGRDGSALFDKYHRWVAVDVMMAPYAIGLYDPRIDLQPQGPIPAQQSSGAEPPAPPAAEPS